MSAPLSPRQVAIIWFQRLWNEHDESTIDEFLAFDSRAEQEHGQIMGREDFRALYQAILKAFPDIAISPEHIAQEDETAYIRWKARGTHLGMGFGIEPSGKVIEFEGITWFVVRDGIIVGGGDRWNQGGLLADMAAAHGGDAGPPAGAA